VDVGDDLPEVLFVGDGLAKRRHWACVFFLVAAAVACVCETLAPECDEAEERVVIAAVDPIFVDERWAMDAASVAAVTGPARLRLIEFFAFPNNLRRDRRGFSSLPFSVAATRSRDVFLSAPAA
jgi:hypothetical protein